MRRVIILLVVLVLFAQIGASALIYASDFVTKAVTDVNHSGSTVVAVAQISTKYTATKLGFKSISIEEKQGDDWIEVKSVSGQFNTSSKSHSYTLTFARAKAGSSYRAVTTYYADVSGYDVYTVTKKHLA